MQPPRGLTGPIARLLLGAVMISFAPVFVRLVDVAPTVSAFYRNLIAGAILLVVVWSRGYSLRCSRPALIALVAAGAMFALDLAAWHRSIWYVGPGLATLLGNCQVFVLAAAGVLLLGETPRPRFLFAAPMAVAGLALIVGLDWSALSAEYRLGVIYGLLTALIYASYILLLRRARLQDPDSAPVRDLAVVSLVAALLLGLGGWVEGSSVAIPTAADAGLLAAYALVAQVIGWVLISSALSRVPASLVGLILLLQPLLAFVWDVLFFSRPLAASDGAGVGLVLAAIYLGSRSTSGRPPGDSKPAGGK